MSEQPGAQPEAVPAGEPVTASPADQPAQPPIQQPAQPAAEGDTNYVQQPDGTMTGQQAAQQRDAETSPASGPETGDAPDAQPAAAQAEGGPGIMTGTVYPAAEGQPPGAVVMDPPSGGPGEQSLAERQAGGQQAAAGVGQPEAGPGGSSPYAQPAASYPPETAAAERRGDEAAQPVVPAGNATSNESPQLPGNLTSGAARAHAALSQAGDVQGNGEMSESERLSALGRIIDFALRELDRFLPSHVRQPAADEVSREL